MEQFEAIHRVQREYFREPLPASTMAEVVKMTHPALADRDECDRGNPPLKALNGAFWSNRSCGVTLSAGFTRGFTAQTQRRVRFSFEAIADLIHSASD
jgi:hypothetical protein